MKICYDFSKISEIRPEKQNTWMGKLFLSFDIDWAHDEVISDCYELVNSYAIKSTWFITHSTQLIEVLRKEQSVELGIHPNFNDLLSGNKSSDSFTILNQLCDLVPEAQSVRSHSLVQSERLIDQFLAVGLSHVSNFYIPYSSSILARPYYLWNQMVMIPHTWQDNVEIRMGEKFLDEDRLKKGFHVFVFHPIHVFLNTESLDRYERTRHLHHKPKELIKYRYQGYGTYNHLIDLMKLTVK